MDHMVQAARSGVQNIGEGSEASGTSKKTEIKLTKVARASLEELRLDYEDFLRQRGPRSGPSTIHDAKRSSLDAAATPTKSPRGSSPSAPPARIPNSPPTPRSCSSESPARCSIARSPRSPKRSPKKAVSPSVSTAPAAPPETSVSVHPVHRVHKVHFP